MQRSRKWLIVGVLALVCALSLVGAALALSSPHRPPPGPSSLAVKVWVTPQMVTAGYKSYATGSPPFATATFTNTGTVPITNFHVSYSIANYVEDAGQETYPVILPGQTVIDWCMPTFTAAAVQAISSPAKAQLDVNYSYDGSNGNKGTSAYLTLLSHTDWVWSSLPRDQQLDWWDAFNNGYLLAAWVTKDASGVNWLAKKLTHGISTDSSDADAKMAISNIWDGLNYGGVAYNSEPASFWSSDSAQTVTFPQETLKNQGGNCVDLSVLIAALFEAVGIKAQLMLSTGHCQVAAVLPSGEFYPIEETLLGQTDKYGNPYTIDQAVSAAKQTEYEQTAKGTYYVIGVEDTWAMGVVPAW